MNGFPISAIVEAWCHSMVADIILRLLLAKLAFQFLNHPHNAGPCQHPLLQCMWIVQLYHTCCWSSHKAAHVPGQWPWGRMIWRTPELQISFVGISGEVMDAWFREESCLSSVQVAIEHSLCGLKKTSKVQDLANSEGSGENFMFEVNKQMWVAATPGQESMTNIWTVDAPLLPGYSSLQ